jgi:diguanylate cyclase (GGDEF)-like protein
MEHGGREENTQNSEVVGRLLSLGLLLVVTSACVAATGGIESPLRDLVFLPVFLGSLYFGVRGSLWSATLVLVLFAILQMLRPASALPLFNHVVHGGVLLIVAVFAGLFAQRMVSVASVATHRAEEQEQRAAEVEWFTDTAVMMQSLYELEQVLSVAQLRLGDLIGCDSTAVFLREADDASMNLVQTMGLPPERVGAITIPASEQSIVHGAEFGALYWPDVVTARRDMDVFANIDPDARSVMIVPLRTLDDIFGVIYVASARTNAFSDNDRERLSRFAQHIVYPIQRVRLQALATTDALTGLHNRRALWRHLREEVERGYRYDRPLSLILLDIDHFKQVNDTEGHRAGDAILSQLGAILLRISRASDFAARYGGEEMALLCPETSDAEAHSLGERIRSLIEDTVFRLPGGREAHITVSVGVATLLTGKAHDPTSLIEEADAALYAAKWSGRNQVCVAPTDRMAEIARSA